MKKIKSEKRSESFAAWFRRTHGRELTEPDLRQLLEDWFGIRPDANGYYHRSQFEPFWKQMEELQ
jgi:protoporphyrinogen oxidase